VQEIDFIKILSNPKAGVKLKWTTIGGIWYSNPDMRYKYNPLIISLVLIASTLVVYWQVQKHEFVSFDDYEYITENNPVKAGLTRDSIIWAFKTSYAGNWHPLTWLSHMLDCHLYGLNPKKHHFTNVFLHIANTLLLLFILLRMTGAFWRSAFVAALFALHPLHVESVAWAAERKDVLSALFWMLTMWTYARYTERPGTCRYLTALLLFVLGLMSKPMVITLPFVLLLMDYWPLRRLGIEQSGETDHPELTQLGKPINKRSIVFRLVLEKTPFVVLSMVFSIVTFVVQQSGGAVKSLQMLPLKIRIVNALVSYVNYIWKMLWPQHMAVFYPHPHSTLAIWKGVLSGGILLFIAAVIIRMIRRAPYLIVGWFWYLGTLVPVIGIVQIGAQAMADRYTYISLIGLFVMMAWGIPDMMPKRRCRQKTLAVFAGVVMAILALVSWFQVRHWRNSITLFEHAVNVTENNHVAHNNLGHALDMEGKSEEAIMHYHKALKIWPGYAQAHNNLGHVLQKYGKYDESIAHYNEALRLNPEYALALNNLGTALVAKGKNKAAIPHFSKALDMSPNDEKAHNNLGNALSNLGMNKEAIFHYSEALRIKPDYALAYNNLGVVLTRLGILKEALRCFVAALRINPDDAGVHNNLGAVLDRQGEHQKAFKHYKEALRLKPDYAQAHNNLGIELTRQGHHREAILHFTEALRLNPNDPQTANNLNLARKSLKNKVR